MQFSFDYIRVLKENSYYYGSLWSQFYTAMVGGVIPTGCLNQHTTITPSIFYDLCAGLCGKSTKEVAQWSDSIAR